MYSIEIKMKYGKFKVKSDNYQECMNKYKEIKEEYSKIPCEIIVYKDDEVQFIKGNSEESFENLYNKLIDILLEMGQYQIDISSEEKEYGEIKNKLYHSLEEMDLSETSDKEQLTFLNKMKGELSKRRLIENENRKLYAFDRVYRIILDELNVYKNKEKETKEEASINRYTNVYYKEGVKAKRNRIKEINNLKLK